MQTKSYYYRLIKTFLMGIFTSLLCQFLLKERFKINNMKKRKCRNNSFLNYNLWEVIKNEGFKTEKMVKGRQ